MTDVGHNSELTPAEAKALRFHHYAAISAQQAKVQEQQTEYKRLRKLAKADGIVLSDIDFMMRCAEIEDADIISDRLKREIEIASWFALPVQYQADLFGNDNREPADERAGREGEAAGFAGKDPASPYDIDSPQGQAWMAGWHRAQKQMRDDLASAMEKKNALKDELIKGESDEDEGEDPFADDEPTQQAAE